jgi:acyl-CoA reductase-like NAD-dependent aldehyde dehydrogenase
MDIGCINNLEQVKKIEDQIQDAVDKDAKILVGGKRKDESLFFPPTVLIDVNHKMKIMREETFGPVICIMKFKDQDEAIKLANDSVYGLNASVWSHDKQKALETAKQITTGGVAINNALTSSENFALPFGGAKQSGIGRYHGPYGLYAFSNIKAVSVEKDKKDYEVNWYPFRSDKYERFLTTFKTLFSEVIMDKLRGLPSMLKLMRSEK